MMFRYESSLTHQTEQDLLELVSDTESRDDLLCRSFLLVENEQSKSAIWSDNDDERAFLCTTGE